MRIARSPLTWSAGWSRRTAELRATERYYHALVQHSSDVITVVDPDLTMRYVSDSMEDIFGHKPGDLLGGRLDTITGGSSALTEALTPGSDRGPRMSRGLSGN